MMSTWAALGTRRVQDIARLEQTREDGLARPQHRRPLEKRGDQEVAVLVELVVEVRHLQCLNIHGTLSLCG